MFAGGQAVAMKLEEVVDLAVAGEELLRMAGRLEALHLPFAPSRRLVRDLGPVVQVAALPVLDPGQDPPAWRRHNCAAYRSRRHAGHTASP